VHGELSLVVDLEKQPLFCLVIVPVTKLDVLFFEARRLKKVMVSSISFFKIIMNIYNK
jgi:hypothetical protein